jgi:hypothetical protein
MHDRASGLYRSGTGMVAIAGLLLALCPRTARAAATSVIFDHPEAYTDATDCANASPKSRGAVLAQLGKHIDNLSARYLKPGQSLKVDIVDVDLAGRCEPWNTRALTTRSMRDVYPPSITLRVQLSDQGKTVLVDREQVIDINYLANPSVRLEQDPLKYDKAMLTDWFKQRIVDRVPKAT